MRRRARRRAPVPFLPEEARALAFHLGREEHAKRAPVAEPADCARELHTLAVELVMEEAPA